jgi:ankyrin repeat protein
MWRVSTIGPHGQGPLLAAALFSACGGGDLEFLEQWARRDADGFAKCLGADGNGGGALVFAVQHNQPHCVQFMLQYVDANSTCPKGNLPLIEASRGGDPHLPRVLLDHGADPNLSDAKKQTALGLTAFKGLREVVLLLLERGASVNLKVDDSRTALALAAMGGHVEVMLDLLAAGADPNLVSSYGETPLLAAIVDWKPEAAELLLARGADVTATEVPSVGGKNALMEAADAGYAHLVTKILAKAGAAGGRGGEAAFVNARASDGKTALMKACEKGRETAVRVLLQHPQIDVDAQDDKHFTALLHAVSAHHEGIAKALLARGASVQPDERAGTSALIEASRQDMRGLVRLILEERGGEAAGVDFRDARGCTALAWACRPTFGAPGIVELLLRAGAAVDVPNADGWTPLMFAASLWRGAESALLLLERGADPNAHEPLTTSPLILACARSSTEFAAVIQALIRAGADLNAPNSSGATPLHVAIDSNNREAVKALLNSGARVQANSAQRQLVDYIYELKRDLEAVLQVFPHSLAASSRGRSRI